MVKFRRLVVKGYMYTCVLKPKHYTSLLLIMLYNVGLGITVHYFLVIILSIIYLIQVSYKFHTSRDIIVRCCLQFCKRQYTVEISKQPCKLLGGRGGHRKMCCSPSEEIEHKPWIESECWWNQKVNKLFLWKLYYVGEQCSILASIKEKDVDWRRI